MTRHSLSLIILAVGAFAACSREPAPSEPDEVAMNPPAVVAPQTIALTGGGGAAMGSVTLSEDSNGVTIRIDAVGMAAGVHGVHLHEKGFCEGPEFASAGAHWNPGQKQHGRDNPMGAHLGDLANFDVAAGGGGSTTFLVAGATMSGAGAIADADGSSLVIHAKADDYKTDPSGDSGDRIACAVVAASK